MTLFCLDSISAVVGEIGEEVVQESSMLADGVLVNDIHDDVDVSNEAGQAFP